MSVTVSIKSQKRLKLKEILPKGLEFGAYDDAYRLTEAKNEDSVIIFDPKAIACGIFAEPAEGRIRLGISIPTGEKEIRLFYQVVENACRVPGTEVFARSEKAPSPDADAQDPEGETCSTAQIPDLISRDIRASERALADLSEKMTGEKKILKILCALNPLVLSAEDVRGFGGSAAKFGAWLHEKQSAKAYYSAPQFYQDPSTGGFVGVYALQSGIRSIMPFEPSLPFYMEGDEPVWYVYLYLSDSEFGYIPFAEFGKHAPKDGAYDAAHYFCELTEEQTQMLIRNYGVDVQ